MSCSLFITKVNRDVTTGQLWEIIEAANLGNIESIEKLPSKFYPNVGSLRNVIVRFNEWYPEAYNVLNFLIQGKFIKIQYTFSNQTFFWKAYRFDRVKFKGILPSEERAMQDRLEEEMAFQEQQKNIEDNMSEITDEDFEEIDCHVCEIPDEYIIEEKDEDGFFEENKPIKVNYGKLKMPTKRYRVPVRKA